MSTLNPNGILTITRALFRAGSLTWSTVRLLSRVADTNNEALLCHTALDASVSDVERLCNEYRWQQDADQTDIDGENARSLQQIDARSFTWSSTSNGNTLIKLALPPDVAQAFLNSVEQSLAQLDEIDASMPQRRADAAALMAENSLQNAGRDISTADRYQVIVSVDASKLQEDNPAESSAPSKRPTIHNAGPIADETARRLACDCSISTITHEQGEPVDIGRKTRLWPPAMTRAIKHRDQHCQYPGCTQTRHLQIHHIQHWADGGSTCVDNGVSIYARHHSIVHEGGYRIERLNDQTNGNLEEFIRQQSTEQSTSEIENLLRNSPESFELVRQLSPTRFRFRVVNGEGQDIRDICKTRSTHVDPAFCYEPLQSSQGSDPSTFYGAAEPAAHYCVAELCW
ncbi:HNH endonuclease signature motif containing protein [Granulosicoccus antarcticus]|uniref:HNH nuclease domain-containing protein n=1 Tax=Granulosicoccus antarcticus IMCC3135 TaxID=1192854 RepID=A0A2Z2NMN9_9GAMM|nr:HNH endonuclease signature motif containing protein [Granulosicoccus antarcticus]ASJ72483.1 hypothetical protein IMCC3135_11975 [Granulosicoccus antarcticus IMCC3135]